MKKHDTAPTEADARDTHFDFNQIVEIPADGDAGDGNDWQVVERGSDLHIAFLEQALQDLQATLDSLKAARAKRAL
jgi:hypothetical protein